METYIEYNNNYYEAYNTYLHYLIATQDLIAVQNLLEDPSFNGINSKNREGKTPLIYATQCLAYGYAAEDNSHFLKQIIHLLLEYESIELDHQDMDGNTAFSHLIHAYINDYLTLDDQLYYEFIQKGANPHLKVLERNPLIYELVNWAMSKKNKPHVDFAINALNNFYLYYKLEIHDYFLWLKMALETKAIVTFTFLVLPRAINVIFNICIEKNGPDYKTKNLLDTFQAIFPNYAENSCNLSWYKFCMIAEPLSFDNRGAFLNDITLLIAAPLATIYRHLLAIEMLISKHEAIRSLLISTMLLTAVKYSSKEVVIYLIRNNSHIQAQTIDEAISNAFAIKNSTVNPTEKKCITDIYTALINYQSRNTLAISLARVLHPIENQTRTKDDHYKDDFSSVAGSLADDLTW